MTRGYDRELSSQGVSYSWIYFQTGPSSSSEPINFGGQLQVEIDEGWSIPVEYEMGSSENIEIQRFMDGIARSGSVKDSSFQFEFQFSLSGQRTKETVQLQLEDSTGKSQTIHVKIPGQTAYSLAINLASHEPSQEYRDRLEEYTEGDLQDLFGFIDAATWLLDIKDVFRLMGSIAEDHGHVKGQLHENVGNTFRNLITKEGMGRFVSVDNLADLRNAFTTYNDQPGLIDYPFSTFLKELLEKDIVEANAGGIEWFLDEVAAGHSQAGQLQNDEMAVLLATAIELIGSDSVNEAYRNVEAADVEWDEYTERINRIKNIGDYETRAHKFREALVPAARFSNNDFNFVVANYLYWQSEALRYDDTDYRPQRQRLLSACQQLAEGAPFTHLERMATYDKEMMEGDRQQYENPADAVEHYQKAVRVAGGSGDDWEGGRYHHLIPALRKQTLAEVEECKQSKEFEEGMNLVQERLSLIEGLDDIDEDQQEFSSTLLRGVRNEMEGNLHLENHRHERALEFFNSAAARYQEVNHDGLFKGIIGRRLQIQALLAEVGGEFEKAASKHDDYINQLPNSKGARFHRGRRYVCRAKSELLERNYENASEHMVQLEASEDHLLGNERRFQLLLQTAKEYEEDSISDFSRILDTVVTQVDDDSARLVDFSDNYATGYLTILAAQRLRKLPVKNDLLDELVKLSLEEACLPNTAADISPDLPQVDRSLEQVSVETSWQLSLPSHVTNQLSQVRTDRQTTFGDHSSLVRDLIIPLEQHLAIIAEYHGHNYWGSQWGEELDGDHPFSIGDYFQFFDTEASEQLEAHDIIQEKIDTAVVGSQPVTQLRNALNHGRNPGVSSNRDEVISEEQFEDIYRDVTALMEALSYDTPVIGEVESTFGDSYRVRLHWENVLKRTWISCDEELNDGEMYYFPQEDIGEQINEIEGADIIPCREERATSFLTDSTPS